MGAWTSSPLLMQLSPHLEACTPTGSSMKARSHSETYLTACLLFHEPFDEVFYALFE